ncbi:SLC13 family permease [Geomicrobium sp. JCM 19037]|uniref:SLC13 family permease n=1 Tax=Geomicrobium sp. JCM 19037 TaxID=1460634 RepID=UPI0021014519|nr:SLC13 family permease [Geomicrobium sp. JCM 19037]
MFVRLRCSFVSCDVPLLPVPAEMGERGWSTLAIVFLGICLWFTGLIPPAVTAMMIIVLFPLFGVLGFEESASTLGREVIWLIIAMLMMGAAVEKTGMDKRITYNMLVFTRGNMNLITLALITAGFILTFFVPNAIGRVVVLVPIALGIVHSIGGDENPNVGKASMFAITYTPIICAVGLITGATGSVYAASLFESMLGYSWTYVYWMVVMLPSTAATLLVLWLVISWMFPVKNVNKRAGLDYFHKEKDKLGRMSMNEKKLVALYAVLILLWITQPVHGFSISLSALIIVIFLYLPGMEIMVWKETVKTVDWSVPILFAAGFTMALAFEAGGIVSWASSLASAHLNELPPLWLAATLLGAFSLIRIGFTNMTAMIASMLPVALTFAVGTSFNPVWLGMICLAACSTGFLFPSQSIGTMTTYSLGYYTSQELLKVGTWITMAVFVFTLLAAFLYWPFIGLPIH